MKRRISFFIILSLSFSFFALDFEFSLMPQFDLHTDGVFDNFFSGSISFDLYPFTVRGRDKIGFGLQAGINGIKAPVIGITPSFHEDLALNYFCRIHDRFGFGGQFYGGLWQYPVSENNDNDDSDDEKKNVKALSESGLIFGGRIFADYYILPELKVGLFAGYDVFVYNPENFASRINIGLSVKYSFSKGIFSRGGVEFDDYEVNPIFPVFYSYYNDNSFGHLSCYNMEENQIQDVQVFLLIPEYMQVPKLCAEFSSIERNEYFSADLTAFINETILESLMAHKTEGKVMVSYTSLGKRITVEQSVDFSALNRNAMTWEDDRRAAAFVSSHDGAANKISKLANSINIKNPQREATKNISLAKVIYAVLKAYGVSYVKDPTSPFSSDVTKDVDFLQFPYQTLLYSGGDCDDLSILNCAVFESLGISTAFITIPGHIFMAFDAGIEPNRASEFIRDGRYIIYENKVWIPLEATVSQENFEISRSAGYNQWRSASKSGEAKIYPMNEAWKHYKAVSVPESDTDIELPSVEKVLKYLK